MYGGGKHALLTRDTIEFQIRRESTERSESDRILHSYIKQWWSDYLFINADHASRMVKIFAGSESGRRELVCGFVRPLKSGLVSPGHAARFVSLIPVWREVGSESRETWMDLHTFLSAGRGDIHDHALLLSSLFLGFR
jgi:hypothetical protein